MHAIAAVLGGAVVRPGSLDLATKKVKLGPEIKDNARTLHAPAASVLLVVGSKLIGSVDEATMQAKADGAFDTPGRLANSYAAISKAAKEQFFIGR